MTRATQLLRNAAKAANASTSGKPEPMSADHTLYHLASKGFWKKFRDVMVINPEISTGLPLPDKNRYPQPGSRTEQYATPATMASDPAFNPYYVRDVRRAYPQTTTITQTQLSTLLLASPSLASLPAPKTKAETPVNSSAIAPTSEVKQDVVATSSVPALNEILDKLPAGKAFVGAGIQTASGGNALPPTPPKLGAKWVPEPGDEIPHAPYSYFPMVGYR